MCAPAYAHAVHRAPAHPAVTRQRDVVRLADDARGQPLHHAAAEVAVRIVLLAALDAADDQVVARAQALDEARDFLGRVLRVVVGVTTNWPRGASARTGVAMLLPGVAREPDQGARADPPRARAHHVEGAVAAGVVHEDQFPRGIDRVEHRAQPRVQRDAVASRTGRPEPPRSRADPSPWPLRMAGAVRLDAPACCSLAGCVKDPGAGRSESRAILARGRLCHAENHTVTRETP